MLALSVFGCAIWTCAGAADIASESLKALDKEIARRHTYTEQKQQRLDSLKNKLAVVTDKDEELGLFMQLGDMYTSFNNDSALFFYSGGIIKAQSAKAPKLENLFRLKLATCMPLAGFVNRASEEFEAVDTSDFTPEEMEQYYEGGRQMYSYVASNFSKYLDFSKLWKDKSDSLRTIYLTVADPKSLQYRLNYGEELYDSGDYAKAKSYLAEILEEMSADSNLYARACHVLASIAMQKNDIPQAINYLALSAAADIKGAIREVMSLQELGVIMSEQGDINRAYNYLSVALSNAVECQAFLRTVQTSEALPLIQKAHLEQMNAWRVRIYIFIVFLILVSCLLIASLLYARRQVAKMKQLQVTLHSANQVKEVYISQFFRLCSMYIDRLNQFCKIANRKISAGQIDDLYKMTKSGKIVEEQSQEFYRLFDDAFLHIYPTFVEDVNALLREKIILKEGELMNNELRILAFLRLGLVDTNQVAQILNYSVNTIYAYRNKLRNRAFDRDNFEQNIMKIGSI